jgi:hypothetical protein
MPNFDGGHYFLTALIPIVQDTLVEQDGMKHSPIQLVRSALSTLPTSLQTPVTERMGLNSPFARTRRTHLARFVVIDQAMYNGRDPKDAIKVHILKQNPVVPQPQDSLSCPFLLFVADFDAASGDAAELTSYLTGLWSSMEAELRAFLQYCVAFDRVKDAASFARYIERCQIETTMPFNDYWTIAPPLKSLTKMLLTLVGVSTVIGGGLGWVLASGGAWLGTLFAILAGLLVGFAVGAFVFYRIVMAYGKRPFPPAPNSDLPSVLKALYLQQRFTQLVIDTQGKSDEDLYHAFGAFVATHRPADTAAPTQTPGVIHS